MACHQSRVNKRDKPHPSHLLGGEGVQLLSQDAVALAQPFPYLTDGLMRLLGCAENPVEPGFEVRVDRDRHRDAHNA